MARCPFGRSVAAIRAGVFVLIISVIAANPVRSAPPPKTNPEPTVADLSSARSILKKAADSGSWPSAEDETSVLKTIQLLSDLMCKAADVPTRKSPVTRDDLERLSVTNRFDQNECKKSIVIAKDGRITAASDSIILATGDVQITSIKNCIVFAKNVRITGISNGVVVAEDFLRATGADKLADGSGSLLVGGRWVQLTGAEGAICHVVKPGTDPPPDRNWEKSSPAVRMTSAKNIIILNAAEHWKATSESNCKTIELKTPITK
jgi:hypothetical protein